jgi:ferredoxin--NADP+ reductase
LDGYSGSKYFVAVVGAGPAGLFAARQLASAGAHVVVFNRDIKPGGLAEYGIYPDKHKMKEGLRKQFRQLLGLPNVDYYGNVTVGESGDLRLGDLRRMGFQAILVTVGAQGTKWLGLPGEDLRGVYHAKDLVYHYNRLPPFSHKDYAIGRRVAIVGVGNVMLDISHWLIRQLKVDEVVAVARRGPAEVKFDKAEMEYVAANLDVAALDCELERVRPVMEAVGQDVAKAREYILAGLAGADPKVSETRFHLEFLGSPHRIVDDGMGRAAGLEVENTVLAASDGDTKARGTGTYHTVRADTVIFAIGDRVDETFGLPVKSNAFVKNPNPRYPAAGVCYETFDPATGRCLEDVFVAGWAREASTGLVGVARKDGTQAAQAVLQYVQTLPPPQPDLEALRAALGRRARPVVTKQDWQKLEAAEQAEAQRLGLPEFKFKTNEEMLEAMGLRQKA